MDLTKILGGLENGAELIKAIEAEVGKEFVPRSEFNTKNNELKERDKQIEELNASIEGLTSKASTYDQTIADLTGKVSTYEGAALKSRIAYEMGVPYELASRLTGDDEAAVRADAEAIMKLVQRQSPPPLRSTEPAAGNSEKQEFKSLLSGLRGE